MDQRLLIFYACCLLLGLYIFLQAEIQGSLKISSISYMILNGIILKNLNLNK